MLYVIHSIKSFISLPIFTVIDQVHYVHIFSFRLLRNIHSSKRSFDTSLTETELTNGCKLGMDSHADVSCVGKHARITDIFHGKTFKVQPFNDSYTPMENIRTVNAAFAHDTLDGQSYILHLNQALDFTRTMEHSLLCPNQARINGLIVEDVPIHLDHTNNSSHSITVPEMDIKLPLSQEGSISYLPVRYPSDILKWKH